MKNKDTAEQAFERLEIAFENLKIEFKKVLPFLYVWLAIGSFLITLFGIS